MNKNIEFKILQLEVVDNKTTDDINLLLKQLSAKPEQYLKEELKKLLLNPFLTTVIAVDLPAKKIVGVGSVHFRYMLSEKAASIGDVAVDSQYRGLGIGEALVKKLIEIAKEKKSEYIDGKIKHIGLTSHPSREAANNLYIKLGFKKRETNVYRLTFVA